MALFQNESMAESAPGGVGTCRVQWLDIDGNFNAMYARDGIAWEGSCLPYLLRNTMMVG